MSDSLGIIHYSNNLDELIKPLKGQQRINFIHKIFLRYKEEYDELIKSKDSENYEELILNYIDRTKKDHDAKRAYLSLLRRLVVDSNQSEKECDNGNYALSYCSGFQVNNIQF